MNPFDDEEEDMDMVFVEEEAKSKSEILPKVVFDWNHKGTPPKRILPVPPPVPRNLNWIEIESDEGEDEIVRKKPRTDNEEDLDKDKPEPDIREVYRKSAITLEGDEETSSNSHILDYSHGAEHRVQSRKYLLNPLFKIKKKALPPAPENQTTTPQAGAGQMMVVEEQAESEEDRIVREIARELAAMEEENDD